MERIRNLFKIIALTLIQGYSYLIGPLLGNNCRFYPTCSCYARIAISRFGVIQGCYLMIRRILRCHPWHCGGFDPVPTKLVKTK